MPTASALHYATECFEGTKCYRGYDGKLRLFRPDRNCARMLSSARRVGLPDFEPKELQKLIEALTAVDGGKWLPNPKPGNFLYLRPTMIGTEPGIAVRKPREVLLYVVALQFPVLDEPQEIHTTNDSPSGLVSPDKPGMKLLASRDDMVRAWPGGFGFAKVGANYGPSFNAQAEAQERGYDQVLWLLGKQGEVTEAGASNFFVVWRNKEGVTQLVTAPLADGIILDGVTRRSVLELARHRLRRPLRGLDALEVVERKFSMDEVQEAVEGGRVLEAFAAGTAVGAPHFP